MFQPSSLAMFHWPPILAKTAVSIQYVLFFRITPLPEVIDFAEEASVYTVIFVLQFLISSSIVDFTFKASIVAMLIAYNFQLVRAIVVWVLDQNVKTAPSK